MSMRLIMRALNLSNINNSLTKNLIRNGECYQNYSAKASSHVVKEKDPITGEIKRKKIQAIPKITLIHGDDLTVTTLEDAQKISKRRDLKLVKIIDLDTKTERPVYKLMTAQEYNAEHIKQKNKEQKQSGALKGEKLVLLSQNISEHDLKTHISKILKWIAKAYEVRIVINGDTSNMNKAENVYNFIENALDVKGRILQKRQKGSDIKFQIIPPRKNKDEENTL